MQAKNADEIKTFMRASTKFEEPSTNWKAEKIVHIVFELGEGTIENNPL